MKLRDDELIPVHADTRDVKPVDVLLVDGEQPDAVNELRTIRRRLPYAMPILIAPDARRMQLEREVTLSPGLGEVWIVTGDQLNDGLLTRAAQISLQRARHAAQKQRQDSAPSQPPPVRRPVVTDAFLATVLQVAPVAVFSLDLENRVLSTNPAAERLFEISEANVVGSRILDVLHPADRSQMERLLARASGRADKVEFKRSDGTRAVFEIELAAVPHRDDALRVLVAHDITESSQQRELLEEQALELEQQTEQVAEQAAQLEELLAQRDEAFENVNRLMDVRTRFYAAMNHEIRTPINAILGFNDLLLAGVYGDLSDEVRASVERSQKAANHLLELVNDVLDLAKIEAGRIEIEAAYHSMDTLIRDLLQTMEPALMEAGSDVECELNCSAPIYTDDRRVRQILMNLLSNAAKFGQGKPVTVRCTPAGDFIRIDVVDRGSGIAPAQLERIFDEFVQLRERRQGGTGLGLAISKRLAGILGGRIEVTSQLDQGSTFSLFLPVTKS